MKKITLQILAALSIAFNANAASTESHEFYLDLVSDYAVRSCLIDSKFLTHYETLKRHMIQIEKLNAESNELIVNSVSGRAIRIYEILDEVNAADKIVDSEQIILEKTYSECTGHKHSIYAAARPDGSFYFTLLKLIKE